MKRFVLILAVCILVPGLTFAGGGREKSPAPTVNANFNPTGYPIVKDKISIRAAVLQVINRNPRKVWERVEEITNIHVDFFGIEPQQLPTFMAAGLWPDFFHSNLNKSYHCCPV